jgi:integrase
MASFRKRGSKWQVQIRRKGLHPFSRSFLTLKDARAWARHLEAQADRRDLPPDRRVLDQMTLGDLVRRYLDSVTPKKRSCASERAVLRAFLSCPIASKRLSDLRTEDFAAYRDERLKAIKPTSLKRELTPIRHLFRIAKNEWGVPLGESPLDKLELNAPDHRRERRLRDGELEKIRRASARCRNSLILPIIKFALATGMRRSEILALRWTDVAFEDRSLIIQLAKNRHGRTIPLTMSAVDVLSGMDKSADHVFPMSANAFRLAWERLRRRAGLRDLRFHDLRHEAISRLFELGLTTPEVALISGHRDLRMLLRYAHAQRQTILSKLDPQAKASWTGNAQL